MNQVIVDSWEQYNLEKIFRFTLCSGFFLLILCNGLVFFEPYIDDEVLKDIPNFPPYPVQFQNFFRYFPDGEINIFTSIGLAIVLIYLLSYLLLLFFVKHSIKIWVVSLILVTIIGFLDSSPGVVYSYYDTINWFHSLTEGIIICLVFFSPLKNKFQ